MFKRCLIALAVLFLGGPVAPSQDCTYASAMKEDGAEVRLVRERIEAFRTEIDGAKWRVVGDQVLKDFDGRKRLLSEAQQLVLQKALKVLAEDLAKADGIQDLPKLNALMKGNPVPAINLSRFRDQGDLSGKSSVFFEFDKDLKDAKLVVGCDTPARERQEIYWWIRLAEGLLGEVSRDSKAAAARAAQARVERWDNFFAHGYSQYPWELLVNSPPARSLAKSDLEPPRRQWVLLHPSAGLELVGSGQAQRRLDVIILEPVGFLRYTESRKFYVGLSLAITAPGNRPLGAGALLHLGQHGQVGYVWRRRDEQGRKQDGVLFSLDLYGWLGDSKNALRSRYGFGP